MYIYTIPESHENENMFELWKVKIKDYWSKMRQNELLALSEFDI